MVSRARPEAVSSTVTVLRLALATKSCLPERVRAISHGCSCTGQRAITWPESKSMTATAACAHKLT